MWKDAVLEMRVQIIREGEAIDFKILQEMLNREGSAFA